jgi:hypothetical protein
MPSIGQETPETVLIDFFGVKGAIIRVAPSRGGSVVLVD